MNRNGIIFLSDKNKFIKCIKSKRYRKMNISKNYKHLKKLYFKLLFLIYIIFHSHITKECISNIFCNKKRVGVINLSHYQNVGTALVKYAMFKRLEKYCLNVTIIAGKSDPNVDTSFLNRTIKSKLLVINESFSELNENDYDYIFLSSDQTWGYFDKSFFFDIAFLKFAENWKIPKFIYGTSIGKDEWYYDKEEEEMAKILLKNFTGISFREKGLVKLAEEHLGIKGVYVLDPTLLIHKRYYIKEIKNYKSDISSKENFIFVYQLDENQVLERFVKKASEKLNYIINKHKMEKSDYVESFIFGIYKSKAVITDSYHGTIFSIIFKKPFISFLNKERGKARFDILIEVFNLRNRIIDINVTNGININLLKEPLNINQTLFNELRTFSIKYLKKHLGLL